LRTATVTTFSTVNHLLPLPQSTPDSRRSCASAAIISVHLKTSGQGNRWNRGFGLCCVCEKRCRGLLQFLHGLRGVASVVARMVGQPEAPSRVHHITMSSPYVHRTVHGCARQILGLLWVIFCVPGSFQT
jgi:hypothetical protein